MEKSNYADNLLEIRTIMEHSAKFFSLAGLSGVAAGLIGLMATLIVAIKLGGVLTDEHFFASINHNTALKLFFLIHGIVTFVSALAASYFFTGRKARKTGLKMWDHTSRRFFFNFFFPLSIGGVFVAAMICHGIYNLLPATMLIFYGLALLNASKYTRDEIRYLGILIVILGCSAAFFPMYGLVFWGAGFGLLNGIYGLVMHAKYEK